MKYDLIIIGAGVVGLMQAALLKDSGLRIAIIDKHEPAIPNNTLHQRALSVANQARFAALNLGDDLFVSPYQKMYVWEAAGRGRITFEAEQIGQTALGYIVDLQLLHQRLYQYIQTLHNVDCIMGVILTHRLYVQQCNRLYLADDKQITAPLLIGADGANSWLRQQANIAWSSRDYQQHAIVTNVVTEKPHQQIASQCFLDNGPLAFLPLANPHHCSIVWTNNRHRATTLCQVDNDNFKRILADAFQYHLGKIKTISERTAFPLRLGHARHYVQPGLALIGDAAHLIHPLAGLGLNLGLADAACLAQQLQQGLFQGNTIGDLSLLRIYERQRRSDNSTALFVVDQLKQLFASHHPAVTMLRDYGLNIINHFPDIKRYFIEQATF